MQVQFNPNGPLCLIAQKVETHVALTAIMIALFIIGSLAAGGVLNSSIGMTSASYLCHGAYDATVLFGLLEIINLCLYTYRNKHKDLTVSKPVITQQEKSIDPTAPDKVDLKANQTKQATLSEEIAFVRERANLEQIEKIEAYVKGVYERALSEFIERHHLEKHERSNTPFDFSSLSGDPSTKKAAMSGFMAQFREKMKCAIMTFEGSAFAQTYLYGECSIYKNGVAAVMNEVKTEAVTQNKMIQTYKDKGKKVTIADCECMFHYELLCQAMHAVTPELIIQAEQKDCHEFKPIPAYVAFVGKMATTEQITAIKEFIKKYYASFLNDFIMETQKALGNVTISVAPYAESRFDFYLYDSEESLSKQSVARFMNLLKAKADRLHQEILIPSAQLPDHPWTLIFDHVLLKQAIVTVAPELIAKEFIKPLNDQECELLKQKVSNAKSKNTTLRELKEDFINRKIDCMKTVPPCVFFDIWMVGEDPHLTHLGTVMENKLSKIRSGKK